MSKRYLKVPVEFVIRPWEGWNKVTATLFYDDHGSSPIGYGSTEAEAFDDLKRKFGYEEVE